MKSRLSALIVVSLFGIALTGCGKPSVCDCKDKLVKRASEAMQDALNGEEADLSKTEKMYKKCREAYGDMPKMDLVKELAKCGN
ncbi:hypothetical protein [Pontibacter sp. G13]|uniref:hypothetical protein n=1 Tax=Pontibacter sp. G13 TaxID=3074898 RepID=UPI00288A3F15|nr:hypothetical protein [Pontibacter sp. G13]WNJ18510.1 hypothetical protein RJD25_26950 [Pontibacter sp. G13]